MGEQVQKRNGKIWWPFECATNARVPTRTTITYFRLVLIFERLQNLFPQLQRLQNLFPRYSTKRSITLNLDCKHSLKRTSHLLHNPPEHPLYCEYTRWSDENDREVCMLHESLPFSSLSLLASTIAHIQKFPLLATPRHSAKGCRNRGQ
jgi:hypothetical protein